MSRLLVCLALVSASLPASVVAQPPPEPPPTVIALRPAAPPVPALKYRIVPERRAQAPGNAALFYHRAIEMTLDIQRRKEIQARTRKDSATGPVEDPIFHWINGPLGEIPLDQARIQLRTYENTLHEVELGTLRPTCDWQLDFRQEGSRLLMPEIQEMRSLGRLVALRARVAVLEGRTDEAVHWLQVGLVMGRHVSQGPTLVQALIGGMMDGMMTRPFEDLIQAPGTPSLYWALASRPRPFIDLTEALEGERYMIENELTSLRDLNSGPWTLEQARRFGDELLRDLGRLTGGSLFNAIPPGIATGIAPPRLQELPARLTLTALVAKVYPDARRALIARGRLAAEVEAMPAIQVVMIDTMRSYEQFRDDVYKWTALPYWQSSRAVNQALRHTKSERMAENPLLAMLMRLVPINSVRLASVRVDRQLDAFQCIEAIRLYAAAHDGALAPRLEAITEAPVPFDPATGMPFEYKVSGTTATLASPLPPDAPDHPSFLIRYELKLTR